MPGVDCRMVLHRHYALLQMTAVVLFSDRRSVTNGGNFLLGKYIVFYAFKIRENIEEIAWNSGMILAGFDIS
jgi:hypothetical protein